jgi:hypothetical protein
MVIWRGVVKGSAHSRDFNVAWKSSSCSGVRRPVRIRYSISTSACFDSSYAQLAANQAWPKWLRTRLMPLAT